MRGLQPEGLYEGQTEKGGPVRPVEQRLIEPL